MVDRAPHAKRPPRRRGRGAAARGAGARRGGGVTYLFAAYTAVWVGLFVYLLRLERRSRELEEEVRELRRLLER
ncbi:MAG: CcmD family protein [Deltaproteobacteria bacterium]|nr:MAG: CcmD family protein [Deltaproteobacteria bacterium]